MVAYCVLLRYGKNVDIHKLVLYLRAGWLLDDYYGILYVVQVLNQS